MIRGCMALGGADGLDSDAREKLISKQRVPLKGERAQIKKKRMFPGKEQRGGGKTDMLPCWRMRCQESLGGTQKKRLRKRKRDRTKLCKKKVGNATGRGEGLIFFAVEKRDLKVTGGEEKKGQKKGGYSKTWSVILKETLAGNGKNLKDIGVRIIKSTTNYFCWRRKGGRGKKYKEGWS